MVKKFENFLIAKPYKNIKNESKRKSAARGTSILLSVIIVIALVAFILNLLIPQLYSSVMELIHRLPRQMSSLERSLSRADNSNIIVSTLSTVIEKGEEYIEKFFTSDLTTRLTKYMGYFTTGIKSAVNVILDIVIGIIIAIYVLLSKEKFAGQSKKFIYATLKTDRANFLLSLIRKSNEIFGGFVIGKIIDSIIIGILCFIGMTIFRISDHYTLIVSVIVAITNVIPVFGPYIGAVPSALLILIESPLHGLYFIIFILVLQQIDGNIIGPKILGNSTGLSAFWVVISILLGSGLFGFMGMLLGVPTFAVIYYIIRMVLDERLRKKQMPIESKAYIEVERINPEKKEIYVIKQEETKASKGPRARRSLKKKQENNQEEDNGES